jgi:hypothetical protein
VQRVGDRRRSQFAQPSSAVVVELGGEPLDVVEQPEQQHLREQPRSRDPFVEYARRHRRLHQGLAPRARPLAAHVADLAARQVRG